MHDGSGYGLITMSSNVISKVTAKPEIGIVTVMRGVAAGLVFLFHLLCTTKGYLATDGVVSIFNYAQHGVQIFFVISGFVIAHSMIVGSYTINKFPLFLFKRLVRIEPPYLITVIVAASYILLRNHYQVGNGELANPTWQQILLHVGYLIPLSKYDWLNIVYWTLAIEFQFYLVFALSFQLFRSGPAMRALAQAIMVGLMFWTTNGTVFFYWTPIFLLGINLAFFRNGLMGRQEFGAYTIVMLWLLFWKLGGVILASSLVGFLIILWNPKTDNRILHWLGMISYSLYLTHTMVIFPIINLGFRFPLTTFNRIAFGGLAVFASIAVSYLMYRWVEKPCKTYASSLRYR